MYVEYIILSTNHRPNIDKLESLVLSNHWYFQINGISVVVGGGNGSSDGDAYDASLNFDD